MKRILIFILCLLTNSIYAAKIDIYTKNAPNPIGTYSQAIKVGNTVYISGQIPLDPKTGEIVKGGFTEQVKQSLSNVNEIAKAAGGNIDDIVKISVFLSDINNFQILNDEMKAMFHLPYAARSVVEVKSIPRNAMVEIEAVMQLDNSKVVTSCHDDVAQMMVQINRYETITAADGHQFDQVNFASQGRSCFGDGYRNGYHVCTIKWMSGDWGNTLRCA